MEPLSGIAAYAAMFVSPADAMVALPNVMGGLDAGTVLAIVAVIVALVPIVLVARGAAEARRTTPARRDLALAKRPSSIFGAPTVVWRRLEVAGRLGAGEEARAAEAGVPAARGRVLSDRG
jgi:hypothetical protein